MLQTPGDFAEWRTAARELLARGVAPEDVSWRDGDEGASLFGDEAVAAPAGTVESAAGQASPARPAAPVSGESPPQLDTSLSNQPRPREPSLRSRDRESR